MSDDDLIKRGDALEKLESWWANANDHRELEEVIGPAALPPAQPDAVQALVKAGEAWEAFKAASTRVDHWVAVEQLDAAFAAAIRGGAT